MMTRSLYNKEYIDSCNPDFYNAEEDMDNTIGTYSTNYALFAVCMFFAIKFASCPTNKKSGNIQQSSKKPALFNKYLIAFFAFTALSFGVAGIGHQILERTSDKARVPIETSSFVLANFASIALMLMIFAFTDIRPKKTLFWKKIVWYLGVIIMVAAIAATIVTNRIIPSSAVNALLQLIAFVLLIFTGKKDVENRFHYNTKIAGFAVTLLSVAVFGGFASACFDYENCFEECPFPLDFNLNAVFHVIYLVGVGILGWSEIVSPSSVFLEDDVSNSEFDA
ncbi:hypothetical protein CTEN210_00894 [Chaetoceros tenuissimus]|uniref:Uncharacterized protein n=1 Tax=Chaetoceros tenuissimus TaxID=426638 RepID=A0AAD3GZ61_9STRA|nr:hypothetical protein CTEN210_00894 [Chaetoceros tenuissimus]